MKIVTIILPKATYEEEYDIISLLLKFFITII